MTKILNHSLGCHTNVFCETLPQMVPTLGLLHATLKLVLQIRYRWRCLCRHVNYEHAQIVGKASPMGSPLCNRVLVPRLSSACASGLLPLLSMHSASLVCMMGCGLCCGDDRAAGLAVSLCLPDNRRRFRLLATSSPFSFSSFVFQNGGSTMAPVLGLQRSWLEPQWQ